MEPLEVAQKLQACLQDQSLLINGVEYFSTFDSNPGYAKSLTQLFLSTDTPADLRNFAGIMLKNLAKDKWHHFDEAEKTVIRQSLVGNLTDSNATLLASKSLAIANIAVKDYPGQWPDLIDVLVGYVKQSGDVVAVGCGLRCLYDVLEVWDCRIAEVVPMIMPAVLGAFENSGVAYYMQCGCLKLLHAAVTKFAWAEQADKGLINKCLDDTYGSWMKHFATILQEAPNNGVELKRQTLKILTCLARDMPSYVEESLQSIVASVLQLMKTTLPLFVSSVIDGQPLPEDALQAASNKDEVRIDDLEDEPVGLEGMTIQMLEFLSTVLLNSDVQSLVYEMLSPFFTMITGYMLVTSDQEDLWVRDPNQFVADDEDESNLHSIRNAALNVFESMVDIYEEEAVETLLRIVEELLLKGGDCQVNSVDLAELIQGGQPKQIQCSLREYFHFTSDESQRWKFRELSSMIIGSLSDKIIEMVEGGELPIDINILIDEIILKDLSSDSQFLIGRSFWTAGQLADAMKSRPEVFQSLYLAAGQALGEQVVLPIRFAACRAFGQIAKYVKTDNDQTLHVTASALTSLFVLLAEANENTVHIIIQTIRELSERNQAIVSEIPPEHFKKFLELFRIYHAEAMIGEEISDLVEVWAKVPACLNSLVQTFMPYIFDLIDVHQRLFEQGTRLNGYHDALALPDSLILAQRLTKFLNVETCSEVIVKFYQKLVNLMSVAVDATIFNQGTECLRGLIFVGADLIKENGLVDQSVAIAHKIMDPSTESGSALTLGYYLIQLFSRLSVEMNPEFLKEIVRLVRDSEILSVTQSLVLLFARLLHSNSREIVDFLSNMDIEGATGLQLLLCRWLKHQYLFTGKYSKNVTASALSILLRLKDQRLSETIVTGLGEYATNLEVAAPVKIFEVLVKVWEKAAQSQNVNCGQFSNIEDMYGDLGYYGQEEPEFEDGSDSWECDVSSLNDVAWDFDLKEAMQKFFSELRTSDGDYFNVISQQLRDQEKKILSDLFSGIQQQK